MMTIPILKSKDAQGNESFSPAEPFPADGIAIVCDGQTYTVYQAGDDIPKQPEPEQPQ